MLMAVGPGRPYTDVRNAFLFLFFFFGVSALCVWMCVGVGVCVCVFFFKNLLYEPRNAIYACRLTEKLDKWR